MSLLPSIKKRWDLTPKGPKILWNNPPFIKDVIILDKGRNRVRKFLHPLLSEFNRSDRSADGDRPKRNDIESESILAKSLRGGWNGAAHESSTPIAEKPGKQNVIADAFLSDFQMQELLQDYKKFFMKRLEKIIIQSSSHIIPKREVARGIPEKIERRIAGKNVDRKMDNVQQQIKIYKSAVLKHMNYKKPDEEDVDV